MVISTMCAYPPSQDALPHWKCVLCCCYNCPRIDIPYQESYRHHPNAHSSISFHIYHLIVRCTMHGIRPLYEKHLFCLCFQDLTTATSKNIYPRKDILLSKHLLMISAQVYIFELYKI